MTLTTVAAGVGAAKGIGDLKAADKASEAIDAVNLEAKLGKKGRDAGLALV